METFLFIGYALVAVLLRTKLSFAALACFLSMWLAFEFTNLSPLGIYLFNCIIIMPLAFASGWHIKIAAAIYSVFQWGMSLDAYIILLNNNMDENAFLLDSSITLPYLIYPYADFVINLTILAAIINHGVKHHGNSDDNVSWLFSNKFNSTRSQIN